MRRGSPLEVLWSGGGHLSRKCRMKSWLEYGIMRAFYKIVVFQKEEPTWLAKVDWFEYKSEVSLEENPEII